MADILPYSVKSIYDYVHKIIIVEGAVKKAAHMATERGHSLDNTLEVIRSLPDPNGKIKLIMQDGFWKDKSEMLDAIVPCVEGTWFFRIDGDEVFGEKDIVQLSNFAKKDKNTFVIKCNFINFWKDPDTVIRGGMWDQPPHVTLFRMDNGLKHSGYHHCFPRDNEGRSLRSLPYYHRKTKQLPINIYHYGYIREAKWVSGKIIFLYRRDKKLRLDQANRKLKEHGWFTNKLALDHRLERFKGKHPKIMNDYFKRSVK